MIDLQLLLRRQSLSQSEENCRDDKPACVLAINQPILHAQSMDFFLALLHSHILSGPKITTAGEKIKQAPSSADAEKVPYSYVTEGGEKYEVQAVSYKNNSKVETGTITFGNGDRVRARSSDIERVYAKRWSKA